MPLRLIPSGRWTEGFGVFVVASWQVPLAVVARAACDAAFGGAEVRVRRLAAAGAGMLAKGARGEGRSVGSGSIRISIVWLSLAVLPAASAVREILSADITSLEARWGLLSALSWGLLVALGEAPRSSASTASDPEPYDKSASSPGDGGPARSPREAPGARRRGPTDGSPFRIVPARALPSF